MIFLKAGTRTKNRKGRWIPLPEQIINIFYTYNSDVYKNPGKVFKLKYIDRGWKTALKKSAIEDFRFHDLRHCAATNLRLAGNDQLRIMAIMGHRTDSMFRRYNVVNKDEIRNVIWN